MPVNKTVVITLGSITVLSLIACISHFLNISKHLTNFFFFLKRKISERKGRKKFNDVDKQAIQLLKIIDASEFEPGLLSRLQWARYLADSNAIISKPDGTRELDLKALFISGKKSIKPIEMDIESIIKYIIKKFGVIDAVFGHPYNDDFVTICYNQSKDYGRIRQDLISPAQNLDNISNLLDSGSRVIILCAYLTLSNFQHLKNWIDSIKNAHHNPPCTIIGGFILFRAQQISAEMMLSLFSNEERLIQPFKLDLGHLG
ncbi:hypothetical protein K9N50_00070 [bacterium]|nr:hypothetical protein [bacterium]